MATPNTGTGDYVKAPENYQREMPVSEQLGQLKDAAKAKINEFADQSNIKFEQAKNDPSNKESDARLKQDIDTTVEDATHSYNSALDQVSNIVNAVKGAFVSTTNTTSNSGTATTTPTPTTTTSPNVPETAPKPKLKPSVAESVGQTAAAVTDAVKDALTPRRPSPAGTEPGSENLPQGVPHKDPE